MKERIINQETLTNRSQKTYSKYGEKIMSNEPGNGEGQPQKPPEQNIPPEQISNARKDWITYRGPLEKLEADERQTISEAIKLGRGPLSQEEMDVINKKYGGAVKNMWYEGFDEELRKATIEDVIRSRPAEEQSRENSGERATGGAISDESTKNPNPLEELIKKTASEPLKAVLRKIGERGSTENFDDEFISEQMAAIDRLINERKLPQSEIEELMKKISENKLSGTSAEDALRRINEKKLSGTDRQIAENILTQLSQLRFSKLGSLEQMKEQSRDPEAKAVIEEMIRVFSDEKVREELNRDNKLPPNLNNLDNLKHLIDNSIDPTKQDILILANTITDENGIPIKGKDNLVLSEASKKLIYEWLVEKIISIPDSTPDAHYNIGSFYITANLDSLIDISRRKFNDGGETSAYLNELRHYRQAMHELNLALRVADQYKEFVLKELSSSGFDFVNNRLTGTNGVIRLYEKAYGNKVAEKRKWLSGQDVDNVEKEVEQIVNAQFENGEITDKDGRVLTNWEKERALRLGRILFAGSQRRAIYSAFGDLPSDTPTRIGSIPDEYVARGIFNWKIFAPRFYGTEPVSRKMMQRVFQHARNLNKGAFDNGVMGVKSDTLIENSFGGYDMQSHGWRTELLYLGNQFFRDENGTKMTLEQILNSKLKSYVVPEDIEENLWGYQSLSNNIKKGETKSDKQKFSDEIRKIILGQRIYLSSLVRNGNFSADLKADLWRKRASLMPSTAATLLPDEILQTKQDKDLWNSMRHKVYRAEEERIRKETLEDRSLEKDVYVEAEKFEKGKEAKTAEDKEFRYDFVNNYCRSDDGFSDAERQLLKNIIDKIYQQDVGEDGKKLPGLAERLAQTNMSFNLMIDDTPTIAWEKKGGEYGNAGFETADFIRLLSSDQDNFKKGWGPITALTESPQTANVKVFEEAVQPIGDVIGRGAAQQRIEPFIAAIVNMYSTKPSVEWAPGGMTFNRLIDQPTSEIESFFKKTYISWDATRRKDFLIGLLQARALGNDGFERVRKETKSKQKWVILTLIKFWIELLGAEFAYEMFKSVLPEEVGKSI